MPYLWPDPGVLRRLPAQEYAGQAITTRVEGEQAPPRPPPPPRRGKLHIHRFGLRPKLFHSVTAPFHAETGFGVRRTSNGAGRDLAERPGRV
nr:MAG TPA: hypothetical protein [Caudoviricetes sp.]